MTIWCIKKNSLAYIYIRFIYKGEVNISILIFDFFNTQCIIYDTFSFLNIGELWWLIKPISDKWPQLK